MVAGDGVRRLAARYAGRCAGCGAGFQRGAMIGYQPAAGRGRGATYCEACTDQHRRDVAADDFDQMVYGY